MRILLVSLYELGHQPLQVAAPAAALLAAGHDVKALDLSVENWDEDAVEWADRVALSVPMHTAARLAVSASERLGGRRPHCFYGLYAPVVADRGAPAFGGEFTAALVAWAGDAGTRPAGSGCIDLARSEWHLPARHLLPPLEHYSHLEIGGDHRLAGYVEASRGCVHRCRHCPIPIVYDGRIRVDPVASVMADIDQLVGAGARHITFGDPDFLNGPQHAQRVVEAFAARFPDVTFDCTVKVEHVLRHHDVWPHFAAAGCLFVVSAVECLNDGILELLDKGHTAAEAAKAVDVLRSAGIEPHPSFLPFTPWTSLDDVADVALFVGDHELALDPVQLSVRLLLPPGSLLLDLAETGPHLDGYDRDRLTWRWRSADPAVDRLHTRLAALVEAGVERPAAAVLDDAAAEIAAATGRPIDGMSAGALRSGPRLTEPWFC
jgi:hypothetical protein